MYPNPNPYGTSGYGATSAVPNDANAGATPEVPTVVHIQPQGGAHPTSGASSGSPRSEETATKQLPPSESEDILQPDQQAMRQHRTERELGRYSDAQMKVIALIMVIINVFKISMASMLSVFVPQGCPDSDGPDASKHECSFEENFRDLTQLNKWALAFNFIVLGTMLLQYIFVWRRERFAINKLDVDVTQLRFALPTNLATYPAELKRLRFYNRVTFGLSATNSILQAINILLSGVLVFRDYWLSYRTATSFFSSILLVLDNMYNDTANTYSSMMFDVCLSCFHLEPVSYNVIDADRRKIGSAIVDDRPIGPALGLAAALASV